MSPVVELWQQERSMELLHTQRLREQRAMILTLDPLSSFFLFLFSQIHGLALPTSWEIIFPNPPWMPLQGVFPNLTKWQASTTDNWSQTERGLMVNEDRI